MSGFTPFLVAEGELIFLVYHYDDCVCCLAHLFIDSKKLYSIVTAQNTEQLLLCLNIDIEDHLLLWLGQFRTTLITCTSPFRQARRRLHQAVSGWLDTDAGKLPYSTETVAPGDTQGQSKLLLVSCGQNVWYARWAWWNIMPHLLWLTVPVKWPSMIKTEYLN